MCRHLKRIARLDSSVVRRTSGKQLEGKHVGIIGLHETRSKNTQTTVSTTHFRFSSAADSKGCALEPFCPMLMPLPTHIGLMSAVGMLHARTYGCFRTSHVVFSASGPNCCQLSLPWTPGASMCRAAFGLVWWCPSSGQCAVCWPGLLFHLLITACSFNVV